MIDDRELRHGTVVDLQEGDLRRVGTPPVSAEVTAAVDLFLIDPIELSIENLVGAARGELLFLALLLEIHDEQVVASNEGHLPSVGAEREFFLGVRIECQTKRAVGCRTGSGTSRSRSKSARRCAAAFISRAAAFGSILTSSSRNPGNASNAARIFCASNSGSVAPVAAVTLTQSTCPLAPGFGQM